MHGEGFCWFWMFRVEIAGLERWWGVEHSGCCSAGGLSWVLLREVAGSSSLLVGIVGLVL
jgi:hypothetical protein